MATQPKPTTLFTKEAHRQYLEWLDFDDRQDFEDACKGFVAPLANQGVVKNPDGTHQWNLRAFKDELVDKPASDTVNPSLWRQS